MRAILSRYVARRMVVEADADRCGWKRWSQTHSSGGHGRSTVRLCGEAGEQDIRYVLAAICSSTLFITRPSLFNLVYPKATYSHQDEPDLPASDYKTAPSPPSNFTTSHPLLPFVRLISLIHSKISDRRDSSRLNLCFRASIYFVLANNSGDDYDQENFPMNIKKK